MRTICRVLVSTQQTPSRSLRALRRFGLWFTVVEAILLAAWLGWTNGRDVLPEISRLSGTWIVLPVGAPCAIVAWLLLIRHRARAELAMLEAAREQFDEE